MVAWHVEPFLQVKRLTKTEEAGSRIQLVTILIIVWIMFVFSHKNE